MSQPAIIATQPSSPPGRADTLSDHAKMVLEADRIQAQAVGLMSIVFDLILLYLAHALEAVNKADSTSTSWQAVRILVYGSLALSIACAFVSMVIIKMCSDLPFASYQKNFDSEVAQPDDAAPTSSPDTRAWTHMEILLHAGMSPYYAFVDEASILLLVFTTFFTIVSFVLWVFTSTPSLSTSGITMFLVVPTALVILITLVIGAVGQGWD